MDDNGAVFIGLSTLDLAYAVDRYPAEDSKTQADELFLGAGGPAANAAVTYAHLSGRVPTLVTALGKHPLAELIREDLQQHGVGITDLTPDGDQQPPVSSIIVATGAATRTIVSLDGSRVHAPFDSTAAEHLDRVAVVLVDGHYAEPARHIAAAARARGIPVVLDAGRWRPVHGELLPLTDIAICSAAFTPPGVAPDSPAAVFDYLHAIGPERVAITDGPHPIVWSMPGERGEIPVTATRAVDTLGAGDILHGAFCHFHTLGEAFPVALAHAAEVASRSCVSVGTRAWMR
ncbi:PfkB family carbohydrate kinase [Nocardia sp. NBC_01503]|uniref:PfkB family carbohydrate kinase n=1 Tax=Nocardia sp. NBC_01503 TaxID=2975997 RepID=UPI002E7AE9C8|nr:PfkB family carbohydrate kinase [Nocardia sp. NBC_01503]WTL34378.1 PfkB family carbohydrate kinase [Nocardia sp. NBC_01503]